MSHNPYSPYSHVTYYGNNDDGAYCLSDGAYHSGNDYNDYLGDNHQDLPPSPEPHTEYHEELTRRASEYGLTTRELQKLEDECIRDQTAWDREERQQNETRSEQRVRQTRDEREVEETEETREQEFCE